MTDRRRQDESGAEDGLTVYFDAARTLAMPGDDLVARVLADAEAVAAARERSAVSARPRGWRSVWAGFGGWPAMTGLVGAAVAGVYIGTVQPEALATITDRMVTSADYDLSGLMPGYEVFAGEVGADAGN